MQVTVLCTFIRMVDLRNWYPLLRRRTWKTRRRLVFKPPVYTRYEHHPRGTSALAARFKIEWEPRFRVCRHACRHKQGMEDVGPPNETRAWYVKGVTRNTVILVHALCSLLRVGIFIERNA